MSKRRNVVVTGAGGFIGGHLVKRLIDEGNTVIAVDIKDSQDWYQVSPTAINLFGYDLRSQAATKAVWASVPFVIQDVYNLAADMGGMGFIETHRAECMLSVQINTNLLLASRDNGVERFFYASSACVYAAEHQQTPDVTALREEDAYPAMPEDGYGWEKLFSERMCRHFTEDYGLTTRVARFHNVYGPHGTWIGGREKAPAAICRKVLEAKKSEDHRILIWGDGEQTRSFMYIDDCVDGIRMIMESDIDYPINLGSSELVSINDLVSIAERLGEVTLTREYDLDAPKGVRGRNSDNTMILNELNWEPLTPLEDGLRVTYRWIDEQMVKL